MTFLSELRAERHWLRFEEGRVSGLGASWAARSASFATWPQKARLRYQIGGGFQHDERRKRQVYRFSSVLNCGITDSPDFWPWLLSIWLKKAQDQFQALKLAWLAFKPAGPRPVRHVGVPGQFSAQNPPACGPIPVNKCQYRAVGAESSSSVENERI